MRITARIVQAIRNIVRSYIKWMLDDEIEASARCPRCAETITWKDRRTTIYITCRPCGLRFPVTRMDGDGY